MTAKVLAFGSTIFLSACALERNDVDVGSNDAGRDVRTVVPGPDDTEACRNGPQLPIIGYWEGYIENFKLASGSDAIRVAVTSATSAQACGKVTLGTSTPPPPPTDPEMVYPPGASPPWFGVESFRTNVDMTEGFPMPMLEGSARSERWTFWADWHEFWNRWCILQKPIFSQFRNAYRCVEDTGMFRAGPDGCFLPDEPRGERRVDCGKLALCLSGACTCTEAGCTAQSTPDLSFDLRVLGNEASGSVRIGGGIHNVYLTQSK